MPIKGKIEAFSRRTVSGWIANYEPLAEAPLVEILIDGKVVAQAEASGFREDVAKMDFGSGFCNFSIAFPEALTDTEYDRAQLRISGSDLYLELPRQKDGSETISAMENAHPASPVFIVGSPRSGTTILVQALFNAGYNGYYEGNLLGLSKSIQDCIEGYFISNDHDEASTLIGNVALEELQDSFFDVMKRYVDKLNPVSPWLDKTGNPETIMLLPRIMKAWPSSKVIFAKRRGIENIISRVIKFPERDFKYHCADWARNMKSWREIRSGLDQERIIEIDQYDIAHNPAEVSDKLAALLNLSSDELAKMKNTFDSDRPQKTNDGSFRKRISLDEAGWSDQDKTLFIEICGEEMKQYQYEIN